MTAKAADKLFALTGRIVEQRLELITRYARALLDGEIKEAPAVTNRRNCSRLELCAETFCCAPPPKLVELVARQLGVAGRPC